MKGLIGKKIGMTSFFKEDGTQVQCTVIEAGPCYVTQVKTTATDGYNAVQIGYDKTTTKNVPKALQGHYQKAGIEDQTALRKTVEFRDFPLEATLGQELNVNDVFAAGEKLTAVGTSKGKGFQGVVRRHGFSGVGMRTHGQHNRHRAPGSVGASSFPSKVFKGMRMGGRMGGDRIKVKNLEVVKVLTERNIILIKGSIPGSKGSYVILEG